MHEWFWIVTVNSMVRFSCRLVGWTFEGVSESVVLMLEISGESPFSSRSCKLGKLWSRLNRTCRVPDVVLPAEPLRTEPPPSSLDCKLNALLSPSTSLPLFPPLSVVPELCSWLNFSMHSSIRAGGAFLCATLTLPQNRTSNFLAKVDGDTTEVGSVEFVSEDEEETYVSKESAPPVPVDVLLGSTVRSLLRAELLPACLNVLMISGTWRNRKWEMTSV